ncbi:YigZ family protein [Devosia sp. SD17-2]|uniref:IMPACT family protein n=1 Tax=Devosia sp. SD17-2 TaxID=2976459 RepID=UPI0023D7CBAB|nr:YigZ family protein [Devosia sp. SD17-2]WEJ33213.1 IMPACT family protein [Devosia sp. SD17-2]
MSGKFTLLAPAEARQEIKKSKFIAFAAPIDSEADAKSFLAQKSDPAANHNCWAWRIGQSYRFSDDGEPSGTAGKPILAALDGQALDRTIIMITRWFGGILLGSGGLIRAYGGTAALCVRAAEKSPLIDKTTGQLDCLFSDLSRLQARLGIIRGLEVLSQDFTDTGATLTLRFPTSDTRMLAQLVNDFTSGKSALRVED